MNPSVGHSNDRRPRIRAEYRDVVGQDDPDTEAVIRSTALRLNQIVGICLSTLEAAPGGKFDAFVPPFGRLARLVASNTELLVSPSSAASEYQVFIPLNPLLAADRDEEDEMGPALQERLVNLPDLVVLSYPESQEDDSFSHFLIGHEIAHIILRSEKANGDEMARQAFEKFKEDYRHDLDDAETLVDRSVRWFAELACDRLGLRLIGPGFYFALYEFALLRSWQYTRSGDPRSSYYQYPALAWRLGALADLVEDYLPPAESERGKKDPWPDVRAAFYATKEAVPAWNPRGAEREKQIVETALRTLKAKESDLLPKEDRRLRELTVPDQNAADLVAQDAHYEPTQFCEDLEVVWQKIEADIVPAERVLHRWPRGDDVKGEFADVWPGSGPWSLPIDWRSILNGAYLHWRVKTATEALPERLRRRRESGTLARGGVELSEIHRTALDLRDELRVLRIEAAAQ